MSGLFWLASYPKSGNTWMRVFLNNYWADGDAPVDINQLEHTPLINARWLFDDALQIDSGDLTPAEIDALRPAYYRRFSAMVAIENRFCKIHDAFRCLPNGEPMFPLSATLGVIYLIRNPLDVAVSYAHHNHGTVDEAIDYMADEEHTLFGDESTQLKQLHQRMLSWSNHVRSWVDQSPHRLHVVRYEDMLAQPIDAFTQVIQFIGGDESPERIEKAVRFSAFERLKRQEDEHGFSENAVTTNTFFRKGEVGDWRNQLTSTQVERLLADHGEMMERFGYLPLDDQR